MATEFPAGTRTRQFFTPNADGVANIQDGDLEIHLWGLKPLPEGSQYFLVLDATPLRPEPDPQKR